MQRIELREELWSGSYKVARALSFLHYEIVSEVCLSSRLSRGKYQRLLNDQMDDFSTPGFPNAYGLWPSPYNYPEPGKRPLSSTAPTIIEHPDGSFYLAIGGSGGSRIFGSIFQVLLNLDWGLDVSAAIESGRLHDQLYPSILDADNIYEKDILRDLRRRGHNVTIFNINRVAAVIQAVAQYNSTIYAASDSRKNGIAAGY